MKKDTSKETITIPLDKYIELVCDSEVLAHNEIYRLRNMLGEEYKKTPLDRSKMSDSKLSFEETMLHHHKVKLDKLQTELRRLTKETGYHLIWDK